MDTLYSWACGRVLLAGEGENFIRMYAVKHGLPEQGIWKEASSLERLLSECEEIRDNAYAQILSSEYKTRLFGVRFLFQDESAQKNPRVLAAGITFPESEYSSLFQKSVINGLRLLKSGAEIWS